MYIHTYTYIPAKLCWYRSTCFTGTKVTDESDNPLILRHIGSENHIGSEIYR